MRTNVLIQRITNYVHDARDNQYRVALLRGDPMRPIDKILATAEHADQKSDGSWMINCPSHDDGKASLHLTESQDGTVLMKCHAGCSTYDIVQQMGLQMADLFAARDKPKDKGQITSTFTYHHASGRVAFQVLRKEYTDGSKDFLQRQPSDNGGWIWNTKGIVKPLYRLHKIDRAKPLHVFEGERKADEAAKWGLSTTCSAGGAGKWESHHTDSIEGLHLVLHPDNDSPGDNHVRKILESVRGKVASAKIVRLPGLPPKGDIIDWIEAGGTKEQFLEIISNTQEIDIDAYLADTTHKNSVETEVVSEPTQLKSEKYTRCKLFPLTSLPFPLADYCDAQSAAIDVDASQIALPLLTSAGSAIGNTRRLRVFGEWLVPPILWTAAVCESGSAKTPAMNAGLKFTIRRQAKLWEEHRQELQEWEVQNAYYEKSLSEWKRHKNTTNDPPERPEKPVLKQVRVCDCTVEAIAIDLLDNKRGFGLFRDELSAWFGGFDRYAARGGADLSSFLEMYNAGVISVSRKTSGKLFIPNAAVSITGTIQPGILRRVLGAEQRDSGLQARFLWTYPERRIRGFPSVTVPAELDQQVSDVFDRLWELDFDTNADGQSVPVIVELTQEAFEMFKANTLKIRSEAHTLSPELHAAFSKLEEIPARLALILHHVRLAAGDSTVVPEFVDETSMQSGIELTDWFMHETRRVYTMLRESPADGKESLAQQAREHLASWIRRKGTPVTGRDVNRSMGSKYPTAEEAETALEQLVNSHVGRWVPVEPTSKGGRPTRQFVLCD